jgi:iron complex outermembrane receptor protein
MKLGYKNFKLFLGYTYTDTKNHMDNISYIKTLTSKNRINSVLMYEVEEKWKLGLEAYYYSPQLLSDGATGRDYWLCGFMIERIWERLSVYINFENFLDSRQTRFSPIYTGPPTNPIFKDIYAPLDGFVVNGGLKIKL